MKSIIVVIVIILLVICIYYYAKTSRSMAKRSRMIKRIKRVQTELRQLNGAKPSEELTKEVYSLLAQSSGLREFVVNEMMKMPLIASQYTRDVVTKFVNDKIR